MPLKVREFIIENGLEELKAQFAIKVTEYDDRVVLNYCQIDSPKNHPITNECRALMLEKDTWRPMRRAFDRFFNYGECDTDKTFDFSNAVALEKLDGTIIPMSYDGKEWGVSTRKMGYAEGEATSGRTFYEIVKETLQLQYGVFLSEHNSMLTFFWPHLTYIWELCGPENRIVVPYTRNKLVLLGVRDTETGEEWSYDLIEEFANLRGIMIPKKYNLSSLEDVNVLIEEIKNSDTPIDEGFVCVNYSETGDHYRVKIKNPSYLAIHHMRDNGGSLNPKSVLTLVLNNNQEEYLSYFPEDKPIFDDVEKVVADSVIRLETLWEELKDIENQKEYALALQSKISEDLKPFTGILFRLRSGKLSSVREGIKIISNENPKQIYLKFKEQITSVYAKAGAG